MSRDLKKETPEKRAARLAYYREYQNKIREQQTPEEREAQIVKARERQAARLAKQTPEQRAVRLKKMAFANKERRRKLVVKETPEEREARLKSERERHVKRKAAAKGMTVAEMIAAREAKRAAWADQETLLQKAREEKAARLIRRREWQEKKRALETPEEKSARLALRRAQRAKSRVKETPEQRAARLIKDRDYKRKQMFEETFEEREARLERRHIHRNETPEQRAARYERRRELWLLRNERVTNVKVPVLTIEQTRAVVSARAGYACEVCGRAVPRQDGQMAHLVAQNKQNKDRYGNAIHSVYNLAWTCGLACNSGAAVAEYDVDAKSLMKSILKNNVSTALALREMLLEEGRRLKGALRSRGFCN